MITKDQWNEMEPKLRKAGGHALDPASHALLMMNTINDWLQAGYSFELDILPTIRKIANKWTSERFIYSWSFFTKDIARAHATRMRQKIASSSHADCKGFVSDDPPLDHVETRKRAVKEWRKMKNEFKETQGS